MAEWPERFAPADDLERWIRRAFIAGDGAFYNPDHIHLQFATIGILWTNVPLVYQQRPIAGQAEMPTPQGNKWRRGRQLQQIVEWFGIVPDFLITLSAPTFAALSPRLQCAIIDHELCHCAQDLDEFGCPKFTQEGLPKFAVRGHDVEEFISVVRRWGVTHGNVRELADAVASTPLITDEAITVACGTCLGR